MEVYCISTNIFEKVSIMRISLVVQHFSVLLVVKITGLVVIRQYNQAITKNRDVMEEEINSVIRER